MTQKDLPINGIDKLNVVEPNYHCNICNDRGFVPNEKGNFVGHCKCVKIKRAKRYLKESNLIDVVKKYTFENYETEKEWQKDYKQRAMKFARNPKGSFAMLGQSGLGKTHLMSALTIYLIGQGNTALYVKWKAEMVKAKNNYWNMEEDLFNKMLSVDVLYLDDFLKMRDLNKIHDSEFDMAMSIIDIRIMNPKLITLISSEWSIQDLNDMDGALAGRIVEMSGGMKSSNLINAPKRADGNYRLR